MHKLILKESKDAFYLKCPAFFFDDERVNQSREIFENHLTVSYEEANNNLIFRSGDLFQNTRSELIEYFSFINDVPNYHKCVAEDFCNSSVPLISCIILLTHNDRYVRDHLIPSIVENSRGFPIEIILVYNGFYCDVACFKQFKLIESDALWVSKGYNSGAKCASGEYVAFFHDDCVLNDKQWIRKVVNTIDEDTWGVTGELDGICAKGIAFVMKRENFFEIGGFDENYYGGIEDVDLSMGIYTRGKKIVECIDAVHFKGMSTVLHFSSQYELMKKIMSYHMLSPQTIEKMKNHTLSGFFQVGGDAYMAKEFLYFMRKFEQYKEKFPEISHFFDENHFKEKISENKDSPFLTVNKDKAFELLKTIKIKDFMEIVSS